MQNEARVSENLFAVHHGQEKGTPLPLPRLKVVHCSSVSVNTALVLPFLKEPRHDSLANILIAESKINAAKGI